MKHFLSEEDIFFEEVPRLFLECQKREGALYEEAIYRVRGDPKGEDVVRISRFLGRTPPPSSPEVASTFHVALERCLYPEARGLLEFKGVEGVDLTLATALLHFFRPAYPILREELVRSLRSLGYRVEFRGTIDEEGVGSFEGVVACLDRLKNRIPHPFVPESNCFLTRVLEGSLVERAIRQGR